jgi:hypothetical protein
MKHPLPAALALLAAGTIAASSLADKPGVPACVKWGPLTVSTPTGYNHVVWIENECSAPAACTLSTDVAPDPIEATVAAKEKAELTTFRGSPASEFKAKVSCKLQ